MTPPEPVHGPSRSTLLIPLVLLLACSPDEPILARPWKAARSWEILGEPIRVGDGKVPKGRRRTTEGTTATRSFLLPEAIPENPILIVAVDEWVSSYTGSSTAPTRPETIEINGERLANLDQYIRIKEPEPQMILLPVPEGCLEPGTNRLRVKAAEYDGDYDDFKVGPAVLLPGCRTRFRIRENGKPVPAAIEILDADTGQRYGLTPTHLAGSRLVHPDGETEILLPRGIPLEVCVSRGLEYGVTRHRFTPDEKEMTIELELERVIDTPGWISGDFHLHASPSKDSQVPIVDRVADLLAGGVEFGVATDHNHFTDYKPAVAELRAAPWLTTAMGEEISTYTPRLGHFNIFPVDPAVGIVPYQNLEPRTLFETIREMHDPGIIQVSHPNHERNGYFVAFDFNRRKGRGAQGWSYGFHAVEVFNGNTRMETNEKTIGDWLAMLRHGERVVATGNSDSHRITFQDAGFPRNYVQVERDDPARVSVQEIVDSVRAGKCFLTSGPFLRVSADGKGLGETVKVRDGEVSLQVQVDAAPWVDVRDVEIIVGGKVVREIEAPQGDAITRVSETVTLKVREDTFVVVIARGESYDAPTPTNPRLKPLALTNPIWLDVTDPE